jgi:hypothetical protein
MPLDAPVMTITCSSSAFNFGSILETLCVCGASRASARRRFCDATRVP